ncbi:hypothetical protein P154DRAFT_572434 [Amniculicola lignicola CBS 123094]|uniref:RING-type domain-containing protein n=1 Tax=Amniculicola lignicola CBS 123094 TaxID=1392246 RepID=A0A6A5WQ08_9PLEO|nr:hypothetical protein P154DRAFT_572434 [Amniculicola lignicola CBS 123094]
MPPALRSIVHSIGDYAYSPALDLAPDDTCLICREFFDITGHYGCQPIRLHCGHVIGKECFRNWIEGRPKECPHWSHPLPLRPAFELDQGLCQTWLRNICTTQMFICMKDLVLEGVEVDSEEVKRRQRYLSGTISTQDAWRMWVFAVGRYFDVGVTHYIGSSVLGMLFYALLRLLFPTEWLWGWGTFARFQMKILLALHCSTLFPFTVVVGALLLLGLRRSQAL